MFRKFVLATSTLSLLVLAASPARAQFRGMRFPPSLQNIFMLNGEAVQKELGLSDEQKKSISSLADQLRSDAMEIMSGLQDLTQEEQKEHIPELMKMIDEKGNEIKAKVDKLLEPKQAARMKELSLQSRGAGALEDEELIAALKISDDQKKKLIEVREEGNKAMEEAMQSLRGGGGDAGEIRQKMMNMRKELGEKALAVLTPQQREQFDKMKGEKFNFPPQRGFGF